MTGDAADGCPVGDTERLLLGTTGPSRRKGGALSRYLGHQGQHTVFQNYLHFLGDWADHLIRVDAGTTRTRPAGQCIYLQAFPLYEAQVNNTEPFQEYTPASTSTVLKHFRLVARGKPPERAACVLALDADSAQFYRLAMETIGTHIRFPNASGRNRDTPDPLTFLHHIGDAAWDRMLKFMSGREHAGLFHAPLPPGHLAAMVGGSRQLLLWEEAHFRFARSAIDFLGLSPERYTILRSVHLKPETESAAAAWGFIPLRPDKLLWDPGMRASRMYPQRRGLFLNAFIQCATQSASATPMPSPPVNVHFLLNARHGRCPSLEQYNDNILDRLSRTPAARQ